MCLVEEGVIKFDALHVEEQLARRRYGEVAGQLLGWRAVLFDLGLVGRDASRYGGADFGNVSARIGPPSSPRGRRAMLITGTQTGGREEVTLEQLVAVEGYDPRQNRVWSRGGVMPSSESMTHGTIYDVSPVIRFVMHVHTPLLWRSAEALRLPVTDPSAPYGSAAMAFAVEGLFRTTAVAEKRVFVMGGHEDGVVAFGRTADEAGQALLTQLARAHQLLTGLGPS